MEAGLPIIGTWEGGQTDFLVQEQNALLVEPKSHRALAQAMNRILADDTLAKRMGEANKISVKDFYWPKVGQRYEDVLRSCLGENKHNENPAL